MEEEQGGSSWGGVDEWRKSGKDGAVKEVNGNIEL